MAPRAPRHPDHPKFHVCPRQGGWVSDPDGLLFYRGVWHVFHQYMPAPASKWDWGMCWGHAASLDKVHFQELPPIMAPTPGGLDQSGCFSGCACIDEATGVPHLLYTGVRLRSSPDCGPLPPPPFDLNLPFIESQMALSPADPEDPFLRVWCKRALPTITLPPAYMNLTAWRDPFMLATPGTSTDGRYTMLLGSGFKHQGGTALVYKSRHLLHDWEYRGVLCRGPGGVSGLIWECPLIAELAPTPPGGSRHTSAGPSPSSSALGARLASLHRQHSQRGHSGGHGRGTTCRGATLGAQHEADGSGSDLSRAQQPPPPPQQQQQHQQQQHQQHQQHQQRQQPLQLLDGLTLRHAGAEGHRTCSTQASIIAPADATLPAIAAHPGSATAAAAEAPASATSISDTSDLMRTAGSTTASSSASGGNVSSRRPLPPPLPERRFFFSVSPDACTNPALYWLGSCPSPETFDMDHALGPFRLDLGDILYAPNLCRDEKGRVLLLAWQQERRKVGGEYTYAGCLSTPRVLSLDVTDPHAPRLVQQPLPELSSLRVAGNRSSGRSLASGGGGGGFTGPAGATSHKGSRKDCAAVVGLNEGGRPAGAPCALQEGAGFWPALTVAAKCQAADGPMPGLDLGMHVGKEQPLRVTAGQAVAVLGIGRLLHVDMEVHFAPGIAADKATQAQVAVGGGQQAALTGSDVGPPMEDSLPEDCPGGAADGGSGTEAIGSEGEARGGLMSGLLLRSWDLHQGGSAALLYCWRTSTLEVVFEALDPKTHRFSLAVPGVRRVGGRLQRPPAPGEPLRLRLLLDASLLEVFTADGEVLSTRVYRGAPQQRGAGWGRGGQGGSPGGRGNAATRSDLLQTHVDVISVGGTTLVPHLAAWEVESFYVEDKGGEHV